MISITEFLQKGKFNGFNVVDLDLPSGLKWATCNIGAVKPEEPGLLFQWGRVDGYEYNDNNHKFLSAEDYTTTSGTEYKIGDTLKPEDDAATINMGKLWRMPTISEVDELFQYTNNEWTKLNGVKGMKFTSNTDESKWIFIPQTHTYILTMNGNRIIHNPGYAYIWTSKSNKIGSMHIKMDDSGYLTLGGPRYNACPVRGVCK